MDLEKAIQSKTTKYWEKMGRLNHLMGITSAQDHRRKLREQQKNIQAEGSHVRKTAWGGDVDDEEMGDTIYLGDIRLDQERNQPAAQQSNGLAKTLGMAGLAAAGIGVGAAAPILAWNLTKPAAVEQTFVEDPTEDTNTKYGLKIYKDPGKDGLP